MLTVTIMLSVIAWVYDKIDSCRL